MPIMLPNIAAHDSRPAARSRRSAFTLIELLVVVSIIALLIAILLPSMQRAREQARATKCQANLHAFALAVQTYVVDYSGTLPGPVYPAIFRHTEQVPGYMKIKSIGYILRPYFSATAAADRSSSTVDKITSCATAMRTAPDSDFDLDHTGIQSWWLPYSYILNTWGPTAPDDEKWFHTDPQFYFGHNRFYDDDSINYDQNPPYRPKRIETIRRPSSEWAFADAWYRNIVSAGRPGYSPDRTAVGTWGLEVGLAGSSSRVVPLPSAPYHNVRRSVARSHKQANAALLPKINFAAGATNMGYLDGHAAPFRGKWLRLYQGGTVNPWWAGRGGMWGGSHGTWR